MERIEKWIELNAPVERVFDLFTSFEDFRFSDFTNFQRWMRNIRQVPPEEGRYVRWNVKIPGGTKISCETEATVFEPSSRVVWRTLCGDVETNSEASFEQTRRGTTLMSVAHTYETAATRTRFVSADPFNENPERALEEDLEVFKQVVERNAVAEETVIAAEHVYNGESSRGKMQQQLLPAASSAPPQTHRQQSQPVGDKPRDHGRLNSQASAPLSVAPGSATASPLTAAPTPSAVNPSDTTATRPLSSIAPPSSSSSSSTAPTPLNKTAATPTPPTPNADARSAVPVAQQQQHRPPRLATLAAIILLAVAVGALMLALFRGVAPLPTSTNSPTAVETPSSSAPLPPAPHELAEPPEAKETTPAAASAGTDASLPATENARSETERTANEEQPSSSSSPARLDGVGERGSSSRAVLGARLNEWVAATKARDIQKQVTFYTPVVQQYYLSRYVPRDSVRADKARHFAEADSIDITAGPPKTSFDSAGRIATMRFRKQYGIEGKGRKNRRGEVLQELKWLKTEEGWKIISERDLRVLR